MIQRGRGHGRSPATKGGRRAIPPESEEIKDGKKFTTLYYGAIDNRRNKLAYMYAENCRLLFNGNPFVGFNAINNFWTTQMPETTHTVKNISISHIAAMNIMNITCSGKVDIDDEDFYFDQTFTCVREEDVWKILTDNYRYFR